MAILLRPGKYVEYEFPLHEVNGVWRRGVLLPAGGAGQWSDGVVEPDLG